MTYNQVRNERYLKCGETPLLSSSSSLLFLFLLFSLWQAPRFPLGAFFLGCTWSGTKVNRYHTFWSSKFVSEVLSIFLSFHFLFLCFQRGHLLVLDGSECSLVISPCSDWSSTDLCFLLKCKASRMHIQRIPQNGDACSWLIQSCAFSVQMDTSRFYFKTTQLFMTQIRKPWHCFVLYFMNIRCSLNSFDNVNWPP